MRIGVQGFVPSRLRQAREARGLTVTSLADLCGVSTQAISQYENGKHAPTQEVAHRISEVLNLPFHFFLRPKIPESERTKFYRSMSSATKAARIRASRRYEWWCEVISFVCNFVKLAKSDFPETNLLTDPREITNDVIEKTATMVRRHWKLGDGPISNVTWLVENKGAIIGKHRLDAEKLDAFSIWREGEQRPFIVLGIDKGSAVRSRFDIAHELGHMVLHRNLPPKVLGKSDLFNLVEKQADKFAGAFLLPEATFSQDIYFSNIDAFCALKSKWRVSIGAMISRSRQLDLISEEQERRLWINRTRRGWRTHEPFDDSIQPESPRFLRRSIELLVDNQIISRQEIPFQLALPPRDIEELAGLEFGYLSKNSNEIDHLIKFPTDKEEPNARQDDKFQEDDDLRTLPFRPKESSG